MTIARFRHLGPDGEGIEVLPDGTGVALGSESCFHLMPSTERLVEVAAECARRGIPLLLLSPYLRDDELKRFVAMLRVIPDSADVTVAVNDWGALLTVSMLFPKLRRTVGRLLSGQKRDPRVASSPRLTEAVKAWHGEGLFSSSATVAFLRGEYGISGFHLDLPEWGIDAIRSAVAHPAEALRGTTLYLHAPWSVVTVTDACPFIGGVSSASVASCPRPCRSGAVALTGPSTPVELLQRGKERCVRVGVPDLPPPVGELRVVFVESPV